MTFFTFCPVNIPPFVHILGPWYQPPSVLDLYNSVLIEKNHLNCLYWNIHGISSKILGEKTKDKRFLETISTFDIIGISELHTKNYLSIPGFQSKKQKFRPKKHKGPKIGGGIAVFIKQNIAKNFQLIPNN